MKRRLYKLVLFLLLGVIVNVAVTWGCANWIDVYTYSEGRGTMSNTVANGFWEVMRYSKTGATIAVLFRWGAFDEDKVRMGWEEKSARAAVLGESPYLSICPKAGSRRKRMAGGLYVV